MQRGFGYPLSTYPKRLVDTLADTRSYVVEKSSVSKPSGYWNSKSNQLQYLHWLQSELEISNYEDWYSIRTKQIKDLGGHQFLRKNDNSISYYLSMIGNPGFFIKH
jgi:hypothetical protein